MGVSIAVTMHLMISLDDAGNRSYTLKKTDTEGKPTQSAHPARFSPDDAFSKQRVALKKRFGLLPTQQKHRVLIGWLKDSGPAIELVSSVGQRSQGSDQHNLGRQSEELSLHHSTWVLLMTGCSIRLLFSRTNARS